MIRHIGGDQPCDSGRVRSFRHEKCMNWQHIDLKQMSFLQETPAGRQALDFATPRERIIAEASRRAIPAFADPSSWSSWL